jgi:predicted protein tyrosine phosphatase
VSRLNLLFICSLNQWRSPTAEQIWRKHPNCNARSRGTSASAKRRVSADDLAWADLIFVMEQKHKSILLQQFSQELRGKTLHVLEIPDDYQFGEPQLIEDLKAAVEPLLAAAQRMR